MKKIFLVLFFLVCSSCTNVQSEALKTTVVQKINIKTPYGLMDDIFALMKKGDYDSYEKYFSDDNLFNSLKTNGTIKLNFDAAHKLIVDNNISQTNKFRQDFDWHSVNKGERTSSAGGTTYYLQNNKFVAITIELAYTQNGQWYLTPRPWDIAREIELLKLPARKRKSNDFPMMAYLPESFIVYGNRIYTLMEKSQEQELITEYATKTELIEDIRVPQQYVDNYKREEAVESMRLILAYLVSVKSSNKETTNFKWTINSVKKRATVTLSLATIKGDHELELLCDVSDKRLMLLNMGLKDSEGKRIKLN